MMKRREKKNPVQGRIPAMNNTLFIIITFTVLFLYHGVVYAAAMIQSSQRKGAK